MSVKAEETSRKTQRKPAVISIQVSKDRARVQVGDGAQRPRSRVRGSSHCPMRSNPRRAIPCCASDSATTLISGSTRQPCTSVLAMDSTAVHYQRLGSGALSREGGGNKASYRSPCAAPRSAHEPACSLGCARPQLVCLGIVLQMREHY